MRSRSSLFVALVALALLLGAVALLSRLPTQAVGRLQQAIVSGDESALEERVDFDALREHLKHQLLESFTQAAPDPTLAMAVSRFVGTLVDGLITPAALARFSSGAEGTLEEASVRWRGLEGADVLVRGQDGRESRWLLERRGLDFVLVGIELPRELGEELRRTWSARLDAKGLDNPTDQAAIQENSARACNSWRRNAMALLQSLTVSQRAHHATHGRYSDDIEALNVRLARGPELYDFVIVRADESAFTVEARGKGLMAGDVLVADTEGIRVSRDLCASVSR